MRRVLSLLVLFVIAIPLFAQPVGTIEGTVLDADQKAVANAAVLVRTADGAVVSTLTTDAAGRFVAAGLPPGSYMIEVTAAGFSMSSRTLRVAAGKTERPVLTLSIAGVKEQVTVSGAPMGPAAKAAPSQGSLTAPSAESIISDSFIRDYTSPVADYTQVTQMTPGTFSLAPNGVGLGDSKTFFRGFSDGQYNMTFDGIPFNDTNDPTHHSWAFFPAQFIGGAVFDRSPGTAATIGPSTYGGSINLQSRDMTSDQTVDANLSYGSYKTRLLDAGYDSGAFGPNGSSRLLFDAHQMESDGYQTYNYQKRDAAMLKYQYSVSDKTQITAFGSYILLNSNTPNFKGATRAQIAQFGDNYLLSNNPKDPNYYGYNFYRIPTDFDYIGIRSDLGHGWSIDDKVYTLSYYNKQNYNSTSAISATSATDKLNSYRKYGNLLPITHDDALGIFRTGLWSEYAMTNRYQSPSDPRTWVDTPLPNFHERFNTTTLQPYVEYEWKVTPELHIIPGAKYAFYRQDFTQYADNGKTVGNLGGAPFVKHAADYHSVLPSFDVHYMLASNWAAYAQFGKGQNIPPTSVFDVKNGTVAVLPKPVLTTTYQVGTGWKSDRITIDADVFDIKFQNGYASSTDPTTGEPVYYLSGTSTTKGIEAESNILVARGLTVYVNGTLGSAKYDATHLWVQNAPHDTETLGLEYQVSNWNLGFFNKRIGTMYNDSGSTNQAIRINPFNITNLFVNYRIGRASVLSRSRVQLSVNNLFNDHNIVGVSAASTKTSIASPNDVLTLMPSRSIALTFGVGYAPTGMH